MITLKELRETGNNKEEINSSTENCEKIISECGDSSDNLEDNNDYWTLKDLAQLSPSLVQDKSNLVQD